MSAFEALAIRLDNLSADPRAKCRYDLFAGALVWSDERPTWDNAETDFPGLGDLRALWAYRASLILGEPREKFQAVWELALRLCPNWPGLLPERRDPALADAYGKLAAAGQSSWEEMDARFEQHRHHQANKASA